MLRSRRVLALLIRRGNRTLALDMAGSVLAASDELAGFAGFGGVPAMKPLARGAAASVLLQLAAIGDEQRLGAGNR